MKLSVIIPTFQREKIFARTLQSVRAAIEGLDAEIIVVNDSEEALSLPASERLSVVPHPGKGAAAARNAGAARARGELLLFLDNDVIVTRANLLRVLELHGQYPSSAFNFYWIYPPDLLQQLPAHKFGRFMLLELIFSNTSRLRTEEKTGHGPFIPVRALASYFLSISRADFRLAGGYEERIPKAGVEDMILSKKMSEKGIAMYLSSSDVVFHNEADRLDLESVMAIYRRAAMTRRSAVEIGYPEFGIHIGKGRRFIYAALSPLSGFFILLARLVPNSRWFDPFYQKTAGLLLGISTYRGFYR
jgi:glycosyltransferase involved in cell wall biosynthesis